MVIDLDAEKRFLPFELSIRVNISPPATSLTSNYSNHVLPSVNIELFVDDNAYDTGILVTPVCQRDFSVPLTHLDPFKRFAVNFAISNKSISSATSQKASVKLLLSDIINETNKNNHNYDNNNSNNIYNTIVCQEKHYMITIDWKIIENVIFYIANSEHYYSAGQLSEIVLFEGKLSQRLKEKIIMLSLALDNNCNSLLREITTLITEGQCYINDLDLIEIVDSL